MVENLGLVRSVRHDEVFVQNGKDLAANVAQLFFHATAVRFNGNAVLLVLLGALFVLDGGQNAPRRPPRADDVFVPNGKKVALFDLWKGLFKRE